MEWTGLLIGGIIGFIVGGAILWLVAMTRTAQVQGKLEAGERENKELHERIRQMNQRIDELNKAVTAESEKRAAAEARLRTMEEDEERLPNAFKLLSNDALEQLRTKAKEDHAEREQAIERLVQPLKENLLRYQELLAKMSKERTGQYTSLQDQVKALIDSEKGLRDETTKLVHALSAPQVRGHWGEMTLRRVAELAGMVKHCDFVEQESTESEKGRLRPDMIVNLPSERRIVVDAKAPLKAYVEAVEATTDEARGAKLVEHARQVKTRVQELSRKEYWDQFDEAPEFVVLFMPGEQFLGAALQEEPDLLEDAFRKKVILATPTTLIALLKAVAYGWRQETLAENAKQISELGRQLYDRLATLASHFEDLGKNLDRSVASFNRAIGSFESRVMVSARKFRELGATGADEIPAIEPIDQTSRRVTAIGYELGEPEDQPPSVS